MECSYCNEIADFKCNDCQQPFMCPLHLGIHHKTMKNHLIENLDVELGDLRLGQLRSILMKRIHKVEIAQIELASKSKSLIESIQKAFKQTLDNLITINKSNIELLKRLRFCGSELQKIEDIELFDINVRNFTADALETLVQNTYSMDLITFEKNKEMIRKEQEVENKITKEQEIKNKEIEEARKIQEANKIEEARKIKEPNLVTSNGLLDMTLKQRIDYYYPIVLKTRWEDLKSCHELGKEVLISNDGKYLFFCKLYLGMIQ